MSSGKIKLPRGDAKAFPMTIKREGSPVDITGWTLWLTGVAYEGQPYADAPIQITIGPDDHTNPTQGQTLLTITAEDSEVRPWVYEYYVETEDTEGDRDSSDPGILQITPVTRAPAIP